MRYIMVLFLFTAIFLCCCGTVLYTDGLQNNIYVVEGVLEPINNARTEGVKCGNKFYKAAPPVIWNDKIAQASLQHSLDMAKKGFLAHKGSDGSNPEDRLSIVGYEWISYGENIGYGYLSPEDAVRAWLKNEFHCKNIMNPKFKEAGAAYVKSSNLRTYWTLILGEPTEK